MHIEIKEFFCKFINYFQKGCCIAVFFLIKILFHFVFKLAEEYAFLHQIPFKLFQADWEKYGKAAGPMRNREMAKYANALLAFDKGTKGTQNMIDTARKYHLRGFVIPL